MKHFIFITLPRSHAPRGNAGYSAPHGYPQGEICLANLSPQLMDTPVPNLT